MSRTIAMVLSPVHADRRSDNVDTIAAWPLLQREREIAARRFEVRSV
jgi:hypothetical protein